MRVVLTAIGSRGDVQPLVALACALKQRGHDPLLAAPAEFRPLADAYAIPFRSVGGGFRDLTSGQLLPRNWAGGLVSLWHTFNSTLRVVLEETAETTFAAADGADLLVGSGLQFLGPTVAEQRGIPYVHLLAAPVSDRSLHYPPLPIAGLKSGRLTNRLAWQITETMADATLALPINTVRRHAGLPRIKNVLEHVIFSQPALLAFSRHVCPPAADWPEHHRQVGFLFLPPVPSTSEPPLESAPSAPLPAEPPPAGHPRTVARDRPPAPEIPPPAGQPLPNAQDHLLALQVRPTDRHPSMTQSAEISGSALPAPEVGPTDGQPLRAAVPAAKHSIPTVKADERSPAPEESASRVLSDPPPESLRRFLAEGSPPVYVGFGSMTAFRRDALRSLRLILEAARHSGVRVLVAGDWGPGLGSERGGGSNNAFVTSLDLPHDWLFQQVAAVVHHGGASTTAASLRAGRPTQVVPHLGDQFFWARRVAELGAGPEPIPLRALTAERLATAFTHLTQDERYQTSAATLSAAIASEESAMSSVDYLEQIAT